jgi:hypothetical protein
MANRLDGAAMILILASVLGCSDSPTQPGPVPDPNQTLAVAAHQAQIGDDVTIDLRLTNLGTSPIEFTLSDGCEVNYIVTHQGRPVWNWANHVGCTQAIVLRRLEPGESRSYSTRWNRTTDDGSRAAPGTYTVRGALRTLPVTESPPVDFVVRW